MNSKLFARTYQLSTYTSAAVAVSLIALSHVAADDKLAPQAAVTPVATTSVSPVTAPAAVAASDTKSSFDLTQKPGEHPLKPVLRTLKSCQEEIDRNVHDYSCTLKKRERVEGELGDYQFIFMKVMHQPFSVYMSFIKPYAGREVVYVDGQNNGKMLVLEAGFTRMLGKIPLDPNGTKAMSGQRHPITDVGMRNLTNKLTKMWESELQFAECNVTAVPGKKVEGRPATLVQVVHPTARQNFKFHIARLFLDEELKVPVHFDAFLWPTQDGGQPQLEESYTYSNLKVNNGFTARDFDPNNNPEIFKK
jgi:hypothetical protein